MDTKVTEYVVSLEPISSNDPSKYLILVLIFLALAFIAGLLIILLSRKSNKISERPPVFGVEPEIESSQGVDMSVPGADDLTLTHDDILVQPVPHLGHPDDEGVPIPKYDEEAKTLVVDTDVAPVDVSANVPVAPIPVEAGKPDSAVFVWHTPKDPLTQIHETDKDNTMNTTPEFTPENPDTVVPEETIPTADMPAPETEATMPETENITAGSIPEPESAHNAPSNPLDNLKAKFEIVKEKTTAFFEGEGEDAPIERIKRAALEAKDKAEEKATELKDKAHEVATSERAQEIRSSLEAKAEEAREKAAQLWEKAKESAQDEESFLGQAKRKATGVKDKAEDYFSTKTNPREDTAENAE